jgi:hypothetical protein
VEARQQPVPRDLSTHTAQRGRRRGVGRGSLGRVGRLTRALRRDGLRATSRARSRGALTEHTVYNDHQRDR